MSLHEQTRNVVATELEGTKQWATRNLHRLKKHIDVINADLAAFRDSHVELSSQLQKVKCHAEAEHDKLTTLLQQKSREATALTEIVDKEIQSIHSMTQQHRGGGGAAAASSVKGSSTVTSKVVTSSASAQEKSLYDELAFVGLDRNSH
jgi:TolA-binding protein